MTDDDKVYVLTEAQLLSIIESAQSGREKKARVGFSGKAAAPGVSFSFTPTALLTGREWAALLRMAEEVTMAGATVRTLRRARRAG